MTHQHYDQPLLRDTVKLFNQRINIRSKTHKHTRAEVNQINKQKFYNTPKWKQLRLLQLQKYPVDQLMLLHNKVIPAEHVHHVIKWDAQTDDTMKWMLFLDEDNLLSLSEDVHMMLHYQPNNVPEDIKEYLQKKKHELNEKYISQGYFIFTPSDSNLFGE